MLRPAGYGDAELHVNEWLCGDTTGTDAEIAFPDTMPPHSFLLAEL